jgi:Flp pilus assembly protein TadG
MNRAIPVRLRKDEHGQAIVEFTMVIGFLVILVISILEMSLFLYNYAVLTDAAKEGVRYAIVHGSSTGTAMSGTAETPPWSPCSTAATGGVLSAVQAYAAASVHSTSGMNVDLCYPDGNNNPGSAVQVNVSYLYSPLFLTNWATVTISATSVGRIQF